MAYHAPTAAELSRYFGRWVTCLRAHPDGPPAEILPIYAWNDNEEGDWLLLTLKGAS